jgi:hypothetical protein
MAALALAVDTVGLPSYGVTAPIPEGWKRQREDDVVLVARWIKMAPDGVKIRGLIDLKYLPKSAATSAVALVGETAQRTGGTLAKEPVKLGNLNAAEMTGEKTDHPKRGAIAILRAAEAPHGYYVLYQALPTDGSRDAFDEIASGLRFKELVDPSGALTRRDDPVPLDNVKLVLSLPDPYRRAAAGEPNYRVLNLATGQVEVELSMQPIDQAVGGMKGLEETLSKRLAREFGWEKPPSWIHIDGGKFSVAYTDLLPAGRKISGRKVAPMQLIFAVRDGKATLLIFRYYAADDAVQQYAEATVEIAKSVREDAAYFDKRAAAADRAGRKAAVTTRTSK